MAKISLKHAKEDVTNKAVSVIKDIIESAVSNSPHFTETAPYSKGEFVNNWKIDARGDVPATRMTTGSIPLKIMQLKATVTPSDVINNKSLKLYNNVDYAAKVEYLGWPRTSAYAPVHKALFEILSKYG